MLFDMRSFRAAILGALLVPSLAACATPAVGTAQACLAAPEIVAQRHANGTRYVPCANGANLRAMVADPADLGEGRTLGPANGEREALAVKTYEQGQIKPLGQTGTQAATSSTAGGGQ